jgi:hypothetical protein
VQAAYNSSQQELEELRATALEICQEVEESVAQAGSSLASRLRALGGHVSQRMHHALHLGVKKALGVVASHYQVDFEAMSSGYVVMVGVEDEEAMNRADALAATAADMLAEDFTDFLFPDAPGAGDPQAERPSGVQALFVQTLAFSPRGHVISDYLFGMFEHLKIEVMFLFRLSRCSAALFLCLGKFELERFDFTSGPLVQRRGRRAVSCWRRRLSPARASFLLGCSRSA